MSRRVLGLFFGLGVVLSIVSCGSSREVKTTAFKELSANYNVLFYGEEALAEARKRLDGSLFDLRTSPSLMPASLREGPRDSSVFGLLERAEEKATKAIQKFSVSIGGTEYNKHIPRAYHLLGMARLLSGRPYPALEAFEKEKELTEGLKSNAQALLGIALTRYHLGAYREALAQLARLSAKDRSEQSTMLELELLRVLQSDTLLLALDRTASRKGVKKKSNRAIFALAKQYDRLNADAQSKKLFEKLSRLKGYRNAPLRAAAAVELAHAYAQDSGLYFSALQRIERKWSNYDVRYIVFQSRGNWLLNTARQHPNEKELFENKAIEAFELSNMTADEETKSVNIKALGDYFLETRNYEASYAYYDTLVASYALQSGEVQARQLHQKLTRYLDRSEQLRIKDSLLLTQNAGEEDELLKLNAAALAPGAVAKGERKHQELLESISDLRFELSGLLAYDFGDYSSATNHLQKLTESPYSQAIQEAALFRLFQISKDLGYDEEAEDFGNRLRSTNSIYASYVNPEENTASEFERRLAMAYQENDLQAAYQTAQEALERRQALSAESLLLVAIIEAQIEGVQSYSKRLKEVQQIFRNSWASREATNRLEAIEQPAMAIASQGRYAVVIDTNQNEAAQLRDQMADLLNEQNYEASATLDPFDRAKSLLVVGWFSGADYAERFVSQNPKVFLNKKITIISQADYLRAQLYKSELF